VDKNLTTFDESNSRKGSSEHRLRAMKSVRYRTSKWLSPKMTKTRFP
jgi:hypothetical protein